MAKFCVGCGAPLREGDRFCPSCGHPATAGQPNQNTWQQPGNGQTQAPWSQTQSSQSQDPWNQSQHNQGQDPWNQPQRSQGQDPWNQPQRSQGQDPWNQSQNSQGQDPWNQSQNSQGQNPWNQPQQPLQDQGQPPMKWFKFIIWVQLFLSALGNFAGGIAIVTGAQYGDSAPFVYAYFGSLKTVDGAYGWLCIVLAVAAIYVRFQLSRFKRRGPSLYLGYLAVSIVLPLAYIVAVSLIIGSFATDTSTVSSLITSVILIAVNRVYFQKRQHLFVN